MFLTADRTAQDAVADSSVVGYWAHTLLPEAVKVVVVLRQLLQTRWH